MSHYFTDNTEMHHDRKEIPFRFLGIYFTFVTDAGVFSKDEVDYGSQLLIQTVIEEKGVRGKVLDLGCGYGVIGIVVSRLTDSNVTAIDVNPRAVELTLENKDKNQASVNAIVADGIQTEEMFDTILLNPPIRAGKEVVYRLYEEAYTHLSEEGNLWIVIRKQQGADSTKKKLMEIFGNCETVNRSKGYHILVSKKH